MSRYHSRYHKWAFDGTDDVCTKPHCGLRRSSAGKKTRYRYNDGGDWFASDKVPPCKPAKAVSEPPEAEAEEKNAGRPCLLTLEVQGEICKKVSEGNYFTTASRLAGINARTAQDWKSDGNKDLKEGRETVYSVFSAAINKAKEEAVDYAVSQIRAAMPKNWNAAAWYLERTDPEKWGRRDRLTLEMKNAIEQGGKDLLERFLEFLDDDTAADAREQIERRLDE